MSDTTPQPKSVALLAALTPKQRAFVKHYVACNFNATEAAARAGYSGSRATLAVTGHDLLRNPKIRAAVEALLTEQAMGPGEVVARLTAHARGDMSDFLRIDEEDVTVHTSIGLAASGEEDGLVATAISTIEGELPKDGKPRQAVEIRIERVTRAVARLDLEAAGAAGKLSLVKKYTIDKDGKVTIELYDAQAALVKLGEAHGIFRDRIADNLDALAAAARSLDQKLMAGAGPGPAGDVPAPPDGAGEGGSAA